MWPFNQKRILLEGRECNRVVCCSTPVKEASAVQIATQWPNYFKLHKGYITGEEGAHRGETSSIALKSGLLTVRGHKKARKGQNGSSLLLFDSAQPRGGGGGRQAEFIFDVRQFGVSQRARLHFSTPVLYTEQLKTTNEKSHKERKWEQKFNLTALKIDNSSEV